MRGTSLLAAIAGLGLMQVMHADGATAPTRSTLEIHVVAVEGGNATLFVTPSGEPLLIDTGNAGAPVRDAERITNAVEDAHLTRIDHPIVTHWHNDHIGGLSELAKAILMARRL